MALRIRAPEELNDTSVSNNFRPAPLDGSGISSAISGVRRQVDDVTQIVEQAHDSAMRSQALADSVQYETRLTALRAQMDSEEPPEGVDTADWASSYAQRWEQRSARIRNEVLSGRGARSSRYQNYFNERAEQIAAREQGEAITRQQQFVVSLAAAAGLEHYSLLASGSTDPDIAEDPVEGSDAPSRSGYAREAEEMAQDLVRRRVWSPTYAAERITQLREERERFLETEGRHQRVRTAVDEVRAAFPNDPNRQRQMLIERFPNAGERALAMDVLMTDISQDDALRTAELDGAESRVEVLINTYGAGWERYASQSDRDILRRSVGAMARIRERVESMTGGGGAGSASRTARSYDVRLLLEGLGEAPNTMVDGRLVDINSIFLGLDLDAPLSATTAAALQRSGILNAEEGVVLSQFLTIEDYRAIRQLQRERGTGQTSSGQSILTRETNDIVEYAVRMLSPDFTMSDEGATNRQRRALFSAHVGRILRDQFAEGGYTNLSDEEMDGIARQALRRTAGRFGGLSQTPDYRRTDNNARSFTEIPRATRVRIQTELAEANLLWGLSDQRIQELVIERDAEERAAIAEGEAAQ